MTHILTFVSPHKSIEKFDSVELPNFVVLTGRNGSGKTHLLTAISEGKIKSTLVDNPSVDVKLFDSNNIIPADTGRFDPYEQQSRRSRWFDVVESSRIAHLPSIQQRLTALGIPPQNSSTIEKIRALDYDQLVEILEDRSRADDVLAEIQGILIEHSGYIFQNSQNQIGDDDWRKAAAQLRQKKPEFFFNADRSDFFHDSSFLWGEVDPFQQAFGRLFATYRDLIHANDRLEKYAPTDKSARKHLSESAFRDQYGPPPWDFVNQILEACNLDFRVESPPMHETLSYEPQLKKLTAGILMRFQDLSSGEKVLMSFALCLYNSQDNRQTKNFPKLLLLDEVDAPLHPSMAASLIKTIQDVLVKDKNVAVILTTHSPSTVALAPEEAIFSMNPNGPKVEKITRSAGVSLLTYGVPTISVTFDGRRQVFVESATDAQLYDSLYQRYKTFIKTERSLIFIPVGNRDASGGEHNSGCAQVVRLVDSLASNGNHTVFGLVDWDTTRKSRERVQVLSEGIRNGLESLIFDPALIVALLIRENRLVSLSENLIGDHEGYGMLSSWSTERWQRAIDILQKSLNLDSSETLSISYAGGMVLKVSKGYLHFDDHALHERIVNRFGFLKVRDKHAGGLMRYVVDNVLVDTPMLIPSDLIETFESLVR